MKDSTCTVCSQVISRKTLQICLSHSVLNHEVSGLYVVSGPGPELHPQPSMRESRAPAMIQKTPLNQGKGNLDGYWR